MKKLSKLELEKVVEEYRRLKAMKTEIENELKAVEFQITTYMVDNGLAEEVTDTAKITYKPQVRRNIDKESLTADLGDALDPYIKESCYNVLRVK